jgi:hypothetical protein
VRDFFDYCRRIPYDRHRIKHNLGVTFDGCEAPEYTVAFTSALIVDGARDHPNPTGFTLP